MSHALAHVCGSRRQIDARRRAHTEHGLQPLQHSYQSRQRRPIKAGPNFDSAARSHNHRQATLPRWPSSRIHRRQFHCNQTTEIAARVPSFAMPLQITIQCVQRYPATAAEFALPLTAVNKLSYQLLDRRCATTWPSYLNDCFFAHPTTSSHKASQQQVRCSHAYGQPCIASSPIQEVCYATSNRESR